MKRQRLAPWITRARAIAGSFGLGLALALTLLACDDRYNISSLTINQIIDPISANPVVFVALSRNPDFKGGIKTYSATYDIASASTPAVVFDAISWKNDDERDSGEFWILVAEDANLTGVIDDLDNIIPAMRVILKNGQTTAIERIVFDGTTGPQAKHIDGVSFADPNQLFRIFVEDPSIVGLTSPMYLRLGNLVDLSSLVNVTHDIPITDTQLLSGLSVRSGASNGFLWIDVNGNGALNPGDGDWISTVTPTAAPALADYNNIVLWSGLTY